MADMKTLNVRIKNKYDSYENWAASGLVLEAGEIAIAYTTVDVTVGNGTVSPKPQLLLKVGDSVNTFANLPWLSAKAADVPAWAKAANKPAYIASEITGMEQYIADYVSTEMGLEMDTDSQYRTVKVDDYTYKLQTKGKSDADTAWADVADSVIVIPNDTAAIEALEALVGEKSVATQISEAIAALDLANTYEAKGEAAKVQTALDEYKTSNDAAVAANAKAISDEATTARAAEKANADAIDAVEADLAGEIARAKAAEEANAAAAKAADDKAVAAQGEIDALELKIGEVTEGKTVVQMIEEAKTSAAYDDTALKARVEANEGAIETLNADSETAGSVDYKIAQAVSAIMENPDETMNSINELVTWCNDHASDALELSNKVSANEGDIAALEALVGETAVATQITEAIAGALKIDGVDKYALATDLTAAIARIAALEAKSHEHSNKEVLDGITSAKVSAWDAAEANANAYADGLAKNYDAFGSADQALTDAKSYTDEQVSAAKTAAAEDATSKADAAEAAAVATAKEYSDGLAKNYDAAGSADQALTDAKAYTDELEGELAAIAKTGNVADLIQTANTYIIFDCGSSSTVI